MLWRCVSHPLLYDHLVLDLHLPSHSGCELKLGPQEHRAFFDDLTLPFKGITVSGNDSDVIALKLGMPVIEELRFVQENLVAVPPSCDPRLNRPTLFVEVIERPLRKIK